MMYQFKKSRKNTVHSILVLITSMLLIAVACDTEQVGVGAGIADVQVPRLEVLASQSLRANEEMAPVYIGNSGGDLLMCSLEQGTRLPAGLVLQVSLENNACEITGTPTETGTTTVVIAATNAQGKSEPITASIRVIAAEPEDPTSGDSDDEPVDEPTDEPIDEPLSPPLLDSIGTVTLDEDIAINAVRISNSGGALNACTVEEGSALPAGLNLVAENNACELSGTPTRAGSTSISILASNEAGSSSALALSIRIDPRLIAIDGIDDRLHGTSDAEIFQSGTGNDTIDGDGEDGDPSDTVLYNTAGSFTLSGTGGADGYMVISTALGSDTLHNIEIITLSDRDDTASGEILGVMVLGGDGIDTIALDPSTSSYTPGSAYSNYEGFEIIDAGSNGNDTLELGAGDQIYTAGEAYSDGLIYTGFETVNAGDGSADTLNLGSGDQDISIGTDPTISYNGVNYENFEIISGAAGNDTFRGAQAGSNIDGGEGNDTLELRNGSYVINLSGSEQRIGTYSGIAPAGAHAGEPASDQNAFSISSIETFFVNFSRSDLFWFYGDDATNRIILGPAELSVFYGAAGNDVAVAYPNPNTRSLASVWRDYHESGNDTIDFSEYFPECTIDDIEFSINQHQISVHLPEPNGTDTGEIKLYNTYGRLFDPAVYPTPESIKEAFQAGGALEDRIDNYFTFGGDDGDPTTSCRVLN